MPNPLLTMVFLSALATERGEARFVPTPAEAEVPERFRLAATTFPYELTRTRRTERYSVDRLRFPSPVRSPDPANNIVHADYFRPDVPGRRPAVVVLHILGADFALSRYLAARLADRGVAALFVQLPYYGDRRPAGTDRRFLSADIDRSMLAIRQGVCDVRRAVAWLAGRDEVDPDRLGVTGISLGGIVSSLAASVDPVIGRAALLLAGGQLDDILWDLPEREAALYKRAWLEAGRTKADLSALTTPFDPLTHAHRLVGKDIFMVAGTTDEVIPPASATALWERAGRPRIRWYDCGHYSAAGFLLPAIRETVEFFAREPEHRP